MKKMLPIHYATLSIEKLKEVCQKSYKFKINHANINFICM